MSAASWALVSDASVRVIVAIDAPLGFPAEFVTFVKKPRPLEVPREHVANRLAFRATERFVIREYKDALGTRPFSPSLDSLTHVGTVALSAVAGLR